MATRSPAQHRRCPAPSTKRSRCSPASDYVAERSLATALFLALRMERPLFLEGEAGVGKTEVAKVVARALGRRLVRLQCYEGLDIASAVYEWNYPRQMLEIRLAEAASLIDDGESADSPSAGGRNAPARRTRTARARYLLGEVPDRAAAAPGASRRRRASGAADRRARPHRRAVRGVPARSAVRLAGEHSGNRHDQGGAAADRRHHLEPHARDPRRREAPLPLPLGELPRRAARAGDRSPQGAGGAGGAVAPGGRVRAEAAGGWISSSSPAWPKR